MSCQVLGFWETGGDPCVSVRRAWPGSAPAWQLWGAPVAGKDFSPAWFDTVGLALPPELRHAAFRRQASFFAGRLCARSALCAYGWAAHTVAVGTLGVPVWPPGVTGSISHTEDLALACVMPAAGIGGVGLDVERVADVLNTPMGAIFGTRELALLDSAGLAPGQGRALGFSAKESFFKSVAPTVGRYFDFDALELVAVDCARAELHAVVRESLTPVFDIGTRCVLRYALGASHVATYFIWHNGKA